MAILSINVFRRYEVNNMQRVREEKKKYSRERKQIRNRSVFEMKTPSRCFFSSLSARRLRKINRDNAYNNRNHICVLNSSDLHTG